MEFSIIGAEDSLEEAKIRLQGVDVLVVYGAKTIIGVLTADHLGMAGTCGEVCELDILLDADPLFVKKWKPAFVIITDDGEPVLVNRGP